MAFFRALADLLGMFTRSVLLGWVPKLIEILRTLLERCRRRKRERQPDRFHKTSRDPCIPISEPAFKRPDPMIYSQFYLMANGIAVTWNNPDITLLRHGQPVEPGQLQADTDYVVRARIWNNSTEAPVVGLPVDFSYLSFGAGTVSHAIGQTHVNLGVKGGPNHPAFADMAWRTPIQAGHYCLRVAFTWADDVNPHNNLGQENTNVGLAQSPAVFDFQLRNDTGRRSAFRFETDAYVIPPVPPCDEWEELSDEKDDPHAHRRSPGSIVSFPPQHAAGQHPIPPGWTVEVAPDSPILAADQEITVTVTITPPDHFKGRQFINVNAFHNRGPAGGVTLIVER